MMPDDPMHIPPDVDHDRDTRRLLRDAEPFLAWLLTHDRVKDFLRHYDLLVVARTRETTGRQVSAVLVEPAFTPKLANPQNSRELALTMHANALANIIAQAGEPYATAYLNQALWIIHNRGHV